MKKILFIVPLMILLVACGSGIDEKEARMVATNAALGTPPPPKYQTAAAIYLNLTLTPTPTPVPYGTATMSMMEFSFTQVAYQQKMELTQSANQQNIAFTQQANDIALEREKLRVEQASIQATRDVGYFMMTSTADAKTAVAYQNLITAQAADTLTAQAQQTHAVETAISGAQTATMAPPAATWTAQAVNVLQTIEAGEANKVNFAVKRTSATNMLVAYGPWAILTALAYVGGRGFSTWVKTRTHPRDDHGRPQTFQRELPDGGVVFVKPEQMETGIIKVTGEGDVIRYAPMDKQEQSDITRRAQMTDAIAALPMPYARNAQPMMKTEFGNPQIGSPTVQILSEARSLSPVLEEAESKLVD